MEAFEDFLVLPQELQDLQRCSAAQRGGKARTRVGSESSEELARERSIR